MSHSTPFPKAVSIPPELKWSPEAAQKAADKGAFIRVGGTKPSCRFLSGATRSWTSANPLENRTIFSIEYRISGTPENVSASLKYANYPDEQVQEALANAITKENYLSTKNEEYKQELALHIANKEAKPQVPKYDWNQILWFAENIKIATIDSKKGGDHKGSAPVQRAATGSSLAARVKNIEGKDKLLDVSNMDMITYKDIIARDVPKTVKPGKAWSHPVPFMSNDINKYVAAIEHLYGANGSTTYAKNIEEVRNALQAIQAGKNVVPHNLQAGKPKTPMKAPMPGVNQGASAGSSIIPPPVFKPAGTMVPKMRSPKVGESFPKVATVGGDSFPMIPSHRI